MIISTSILLSCYLVYHSFSQLVHVQMSSPLEYIIVSLKGFLESVVKVPVYLENYPSIRNLANWNAGMLNSIDNSSLPNSE